MCMTPENLCTLPVSAREQVSQPRDAGPPDDAAVTDDAAVDVPSVDVPSVDVPSVDVPSVDVPSVDVPSADVPSLDVSSADVSLDRPQPTGCRSDTDCFFGHASGRCNEGSCSLGACMAGFSNCNGDPLDGCETSLETDPAHCGACGRQCNLPPNTPSTLCRAGMCVRSSCNTGFADCNGAASDGCEVEVLTSTAHCGACGNACPDFTSSTLGGASTTCRAGSCSFSMCVSGRGDCDSLVTNGCEVDLLTSNAHCGACAARCDPRPNASASCAGGACRHACSPGYGDCNSDLNSPMSNGCERDLRVDPEACGACNRRCASNEACSAGACVAVPYGAVSATVPFEPTTSIRLPSGVHHFTSVLIPETVTVTVAPPGILEIYARGAIVIAGTIDVSGGRGGNGSAADTMTCRGGNGGGGGTGTTVEGRDGMPSVFNPAGLGGDGTAGTNGTASVEGAGEGGAMGGGSGGPPLSPGPGGGGGGWAGGGGGGGSAGCTGCPAGNGGGNRGGSGGNGGGGGEAGSATSIAGYNGTPGRAQSAGGGGGGGGSIGTVAAADFVLATFFHPGSAGGGGGAPAAFATGICNPAPAVGGGGGGGGGGAVRLASATRVTIGANGAVLANGGRGGTGTRTGGGAGSGGGGGGSGGAIHLWAPVVSVLGTVSARGAEGGITPVLNTGTGGNGGVGRVRVGVDGPHCSLGGSFSPTLVSGCTPAETQLHTAVVAFP
jgi:hypothetical protein